MKKLLLLFVLLIGFNVYSQRYEAEKNKLEAELKTELNNDYDAIDVKKVKELRKKLTLLKKTIKKNYIDSTKTVEYDFHTKKYTRSNVLPVVGEPLVLKIKNINRLAYDVSIKSSDVAIMDENFSNEIKTASQFSSTAGTITIEKKEIVRPHLSPESFKQQSNPQQSEKEIKILESLKNDIQLSMNKIKFLMDEKSNIANELVTLSIKLESTNKDLTDQIQSEKDKIDKKNDEIRKIEAAILVEQQLINSIRNELIEKQNTSDAVYSSFNRLNEIYNDIIEKYTEIITYEIDYQNFRYCALNPNLTQKEYTDKLKDIEFFYHKRFKFKNSLMNFNNSILSFNRYYDLSMNDYRLLDKLKEDSRENVRSKYQQIKNEVDKIKMAFDVLDIPTKLLKVEAIHNVLINDKAYEIVSAPIQPFEDFVTFDVTIKHRDPLRISEFDDNRQFTYMEYTRGGVRFDFSTGVVFNFGGNNNKYEIRDVVITGVDENQNQIVSNKKQIVLSDRNDFTPMLSGMFHTSFRRNGIWSLGLTLGASLNVETFQLNSLFPGVSLLIGKKQKFIITAGPAFRQVDVLKDNYNVGVDYEVGDITDSSQLTSKQFKIGGFIGISYNLTQKQRGKFKINGAE